MIQHKIIIAIDGYSSCGKSTFAKAIAKHLGYAYIDTGAMYRAATLFALNNQLITGKEVNEKGLIEKLDEINIHFEYDKNTQTNTTFLNGINVEREIRSLRVSNVVSPVSVIKEVRHKLVKLQQEMGIKKGIVMDGRDIGTTVFPNAELKIFMTASSQIRAERRYKEMIEKGDQVDFDEIKKNIEERDYIDENREESPLRKADDAIILDNSAMTPDEQMEWFLDLLKKY